MKSIVTNPDTDYIYGDNFRNLAQHLDLLVHQACRTVKTTTKRPTTTPLSSHPTLSTPTPWRPKFSQRTGQTPSAWTRQSTQVPSLPFCEHGVTEAPLPSEGNSLWTLTLTQILSSVALSCLFKVVPKHLW